MADSGSNMTMHPGVSNRVQYGYTVAEMLIVIMVIGILAALTFSGVQSSNARGRDAERTADIDVLHSRLEEYFSDYGGYPSTLAATNLPGVNPEALKDPQGVIVVIEAPVANLVAAQAAAAPTASANYKYTPYPTNCSGSNCTGYVLKSFIEVPTERVPNPYERLGLQNN